MNHSQQEGGWDVVLITIHMRRMNLPTGGRTRDIEYLLLRALLAPDEHILIECS